MESNHGIPQNTRYTACPRTAQTSRPKKHANLHQSGKALFQNVDEDYHVKVAETLDEACKLLEVGFEYVCQKDSLMFFRNRK
jgi:hypothetical protein